jgi:hypothetical protein
MSENDKLRILKELILSDTFAASFQTLGQYRSALLHAIEEINKARP